MRLKRMVPTVALALVGVAPASALAGTATVAELRQGRGDEVVQYVAYTAPAGEANRVVARLTGSGASIVGTLTDTVGVVPGPGCTRPIPADPTTVECRLGDGGSTSGVAANAFSFVLGDLDDSAEIVNSPTTSGNFYGGPGNDVLRAGPGSGGDAEDAGVPSGGTLEGGPGNDVVEGGPGDDLLLESGAAATGADTLRGGEGTDAVTYSGRRATVRADLAGDRDDGAGGERDLISGVENLAGGRAGDRLTGDGTDNELVGNGGSDRLSGAGGDDTLFSAGVDFFPGGARTRDRLAGGSGRDYLVGTAGGNRMNGGRGSDTVLAGGGADRIRARDGSTDDLSCGSGRDGVLLDAADTIDRRCERIRRRGLPRGVFVNQSGTLSLLGSADRPYADPRISCPGDFRAARCRVTVTLSRGGRLLGRARGRVRRGTDTEVFTYLNSRGRRELRNGGRARLSVRTLLPRGGYRSIAYVVSVDDLGL